jgi:alkaline phosphatase
MNNNSKNSMCTLALTLAVSCSALALSKGDARKESSQMWYAQGQQATNKAMMDVQKVINNSRRTAKNIILFVGDGMGISTTTAARIYDGQRKGMTGEENKLFFESFPYQALSKTYNTNQQTPDSAGTMTAMMTGMKTKAGFISVGQAMTRADCSGMTGNTLTTALEHAEHIGMSTGVVSTARLTHATPASTYAHVPERNYEDDGDASKMTNASGCDDIAQQLVEFKHRYGNGLEVALGGGRKNFIKRSAGADPENGGKGERKDDRDLTTEWLANHPNSAYVWNQAQFDAIDIASTDHLLGLFNMSHMQYEEDRANDKGGEPSLSEMTSKAIQILKKNQKGYFLHVESGRIDHAHHASNARSALVETIEFANAVKKAYEMTDPNDTLIIVTADHSHVFTITGYPTRGNPILGKVVGNDRAGNPKTTAVLASDGLPYTTLGYTNGLKPDLVNGSNTHCHKPCTTGTRIDLTNIDTTGQGFHQQAMLPLRSETHAAEDVAIYASGPGASLFQGTVEQNVIFHVMNKAGRLSQRSGLPPIK